MVRGKELYLGQDMPNLKAINLMSPASVTTPVGRVDRQVTSVRVRDWLLAALTVSSGAVDAISFVAF